VMDCELFTLFAFTCNAISLTNDEGLMLGFGHLISMQETISCTSVRLVLFQMWRSSKRA